MKKLDRIRLYLPCVIMTLFFLACASDPQNFEVVDGIRTAYSVWGHDDTDIAVVHFLSIDDCAKCHVEARLIFDSIRNSHPRAIFVAAVTSNNSAAVSLFRQRERDYNVVIRDYGTLSANLGVPLGTSVVALTAEGELLYTQ